MVARNAFLCWSLVDLEVYTPAEGALEGLCAMERIQSGLWQSVTH
jgi:hypothetical protein